MLRELAQDLVDLIFDWGYLGIFLLMAVESSFVPFPSEIVLIPAGYLASQGEMSISLIFLSSLGGSMVGAFVNYYLAVSLGRKLLLKYGKYFFIQEETLLKMEEFFAKHGAISTFSGRLIPGIRQLISIPAGLSKMHLGKFTAYTALGAGMWSLVLIALGYIIGENQHLIESYLKQITAVVVVGVVVGGYIYYKKHTRK